MTTGDRLAALAERARRLYAARVANTPFALASWTAVVITASSQRQAERYHSEFRLREMAGRIPTNVRYIAVPDTGASEVGRQLSTPSGSIWEAAGRTHRPSVWIGGGSVLNVAVELNRRYPIQTSIRRIPEPIVRCVAGEGRLTREYRTCEDTLEPSEPGGEFAIAKAALRIVGLLEGERDLAAALQRLGGGMEITTAVNLPMGSGLGMSSILAATTLRAVSEMMGVATTCHTLSEQVMRLEQLITTGGGWQDQTGGICPGAKLMITGPGLHQRVRVQPVRRTQETQSEFESLVVIYYTGLRRVARGLLRQVVGRYLARETACIRVLQSIKTLAIEMAYTLQDGEWDRLGELLDHHWELNQILDPNTMNAPINALLEAARPLIRGAKLAGAGGGGFLILLARSPAARRDLQLFLDQNAAQAGGATCDWHIASEGLRVTRN